MALFDTSSLNEGVRKREVFGWAMYDFANSGYTTVVITAVFNAYFVAVVAQRAPWATLAWTATPVAKRGAKRKCRADGPPFRFPESEAFERGVQAGSSFGTPVTSTRHRRHAPTS